MTLTLRYKKTCKIQVQSLKKTGTVAAFGGCARPPADGSLRSPTPPRRSLRSPPPCAEKRKIEKIFPHKKLVGKNSRKKIEKILKKKIRQTFFFFRFSKFFFRRILSYDEYITHTKLYDHRSRGSGDNRADRQTQVDDLLYRFMKVLLEEWTDGQIILVIYVDGSIVEQHLLANIRKVYIRAGMTRQLFIGDFETGLMMSWVKGRI